MTIEVVLTTLLIIILICFMRKSKTKMPPGPIGVPLLGHKAVTTVKQVEELKSRYGNIFMTTAGSVRFLYITDFKLSKEALSRAEFADRPHWSSLQFFKEEEKMDVATGIIFSNGTLWSTNRRFLLRHLRELGMGRSKLEGIVLREVEDLVEDFKSLTKEPSKLPFSINICILNVIWQLVASHRYKFTDTKVEEFMTAANDLMNSSFDAALPDFFPILRYVLPRTVLNSISRRNVLNKAAQKFMTIIQSFIDQHSTSLDKENPRDLMDEYLLEMNNQKFRENHFSVTDLVRNTFDLFVAGNDTTASVVRWFLLYMSHHRKVQEEIQELIDKYVPQHTIPGLEHREKLAYLDATINEVQRVCSFAPFGTFRSTVADTNFKGYFIPKDTVVLAISGISHKDSNYWTKPDIFDPSKFLDTEGKFLSSCDGFHPFGMGKRKCLGEQLARMELYLICGALLQNFSFGPSKGKDVDLNPLCYPLFQRPNTNQLISIKLRRQW